MRKQVVFYIISCVIFAVPSYADLIMKITADDTVLALGETTTVRVYGYAEEATAGNGLYDWSVSAVVSEGGIVQVNSFTILEPFPVDPFSDATKNVGAVGNIDASAFISLSATESNAGVGGYSELFNFEIEGANSGQVTYSLTEILGDLFISPTESDPIANVSFNQQDSVGTITVVPEPTSMLLLSGLGLLGYLRRRNA